MKRLLWIFVAVTMIFLGACAAPSAHPTSITPPEIPQLIFCELIEEGDKPTWVNELGKWKPATGIVDGEEKVLTSEYFEEDTYVINAESGQPILVFKWNETGSKLCEQITTRLMGKPLGLFLGEEPLLGVDGKPIAPIVEEPITEYGQIQGLSPEEAKELSLLLNAARRYGVR